ncbi:MAG: outer membrane protein assembly factor BamB [Kiritimatiellia bacterium]|jgi:outer membrane protein assembly factor BamB
MKQLLSGMLLVSLLSASQAKDWTHFRGPNVDGISPETGLLKSWPEGGPKLLWKSNGVGKGYASLSMADGKIYTTGNTGSGQAVIASSLENGKQIWSTALTEADPKHGYDGSRCTPTIDGDRLYVVPSDGQIVCLKAADGSIVWRHAFKEWGGKMMSGWGYSESPLIDGDHVIFNPGGEKAMLVALDKKTGEVIWKSSGAAEGDQGKDGAGYGCIVISHAAGVKQYVAMTGKGVIGVRASNGEHLWGYNRVANKTACIPTPIVVDDYIIASSGYNDGGAACLKLSAAGKGIQADEVWWKSNSELQNHHGGMVLLGEYVYLGHKHNSGFPTCVEWKTGELKWGGKDNRGPGKGSAAVLLVDGHLLFRYEDGLIALIEATPEAYNLKSTFTPVFQKGKSWSHPVVLDGKLYLREQDFLMCYDIKG